MDKNEDEISIEKILEISKQMGVKIHNKENRKHYICDENGEMVEFDVDILFDNK